ncbi:bifunctional diaminohydroxyphosphoribosylaminopyrimidine deaminase/5-amino-6-(5-phosphoribosylamino)uracil reductase RibD [Desulforhopalus sp. 52FAK]
MTDEQFMRLAIDEAKKGVGRTSPNPVVGAVIVKDGKVVGKGYHKKAGTPHAEIHAINNATGNLKGTTIYVTLEPCSHTGKTPPCCEAIAKTGISRVVVGMKDPNPVVNGRGILYLRESGAEVVYGILEKECIDINLPFIKCMKTSLPYMVMKAGVSLDGRLNYQRGVPGWMTGEEVGLKVHQLRDRYDSIMVGSKTILSDNPSLTTRLVGNDHRDPARIIIDTHLTTPLSAKVYVNSSEGKSYVICSKEADSDRRLMFEQQGVCVLTVDKTSNGINLKQALRKIAEQGISSVLVEGGSILHGGLLAEELYDYAYLFYGAVFAGDSGQSLTANLDVKSRDLSPKLEQPVFESYGKDMLVRGKILYPTDI